ncbi:Hypothetical predicted protein [Mytilus galloprovincialis]|uniref:Uncharacterized protein n=1 Tax=Mytilus galloprovincialis TaxID=29158 RepID=A0A8B6FAU0_MYTGA|nr:Hypothetical predicted protein [Mytilus galloprovincialis]
MFEFCLAKLNICNLINTKDRKITPSSSTLKIETAPSSMACSIMCCYLESCCYASYDNKTTQCILDESCCPQSELTGDALMMKKSTGSLQCQNGWLKNENNCYFFSNDAMNWNDSKISLSSNVEMSNRSIKIVRVTKDDYDKVCAITPPGQIYSGTDYLPDYFHMLLDMPNVEAYAAVVDGKFASFSLSYVVDNGRTVVTRAGRTNKDYAGMGLFDMLLKNTTMNRNYDKIAVTGGAHVKAIFDQIKDGKKRENSYDGIQILYYISRSTEKYT